MPTAECSLPFLQPTVTTTNSEPRQMTGGFVSSNELPVPSTRTRRKKSVRKRFVDHESKKTIVVEVEDPTIHTVNYSWFFDQITKTIKEKVKEPEFVEGMTADFNTTTPVQKIVSQITLMYSVNSYFNFDLLLGCGIPAVEMLGTEEDWKK